MSKIFLLQKTPKCYVQHLDQLIFKESISSEFIFTSCWQENQWTLLVYNFENTLASKFKLLQVTRPKGFSASKCGVGILFISYFFILHFCIIFFILYYIFMITLASGIDVGQRINVGPRKFDKLNKHRALNTRFLCSK